MSQHDSSHEYDYSSEDSHEHGDEDIYHRSNNQPSASESAPLHFSGSTEDSIEVLSREMKSFSVNTNAVVTRHVDPLARRKGALPLTTTLVEVGAAAYALYQIAQAAEYTLDKLKALYDKLTFKFDDYVESVDPSKGYSPVRTVDAVQCFPWVRIEVFNSYLDALDTADVFELDVRRRWLNSLNVISSSYLPPFSRYDRFPADGSYVCLYGPRMCADMFVIRDALTCRMYKDLEKDVQDKIHRMHISIAALKKCLLEPLDLQSPSYFTRDIFETYFSLSYES